MASSTVAVAGGTGGLGRAIVEALKVDGRYEVLVLVRKTNPEFEASTGVKTLAVDYTDVSSLAALLEAKNVDTVLSTLAFGDPVPEKNVLEAAARSKVTRRVVPNMWSLIPFAEKHLAKNPIAARAVENDAWLSQSGLEWAAVRPGLFLEYYVLGLPSYIKMNGIFVDVQNNVATLPVEGKAELPLTYTHDIGKYTAALLGVDKWERYYYIQGDKVSYNEVLAQAEKAKGVKFDVVYETREMLEKLQAGELPLSPQRKTALGVLGGGMEAVDMMSRVLAGMALAIEDGDVNYEGPFLNDMFPDIKPVTLKEGWKQVASKP